MSTVSSSSHFPSSAGRLRSSTAARRKTKPSSVRYVNSGFQTHSQRVNTHCWGKAKGDESFSFLLCVSSYEG